MPSSVPATRGTSAAYAPAAPRVPVRSWLTLGRPMKILMHILEVAWQILVVAGVIAGVIAWSRRGFRVPVQIHRLALGLFIVGTLVAVGSYVTHVRSLSFTALVMLGLPISAYAGWVIAGCPPNEPENGRRMDLSRVGEHRRK